jgi:membrane-bound metal-dependent hydrolase YbcI (DUF457 family)
VDPVSHVAFAYNLVRLRRAPRADRGVVAAVVLGALSPDVDVFLLPLGWDRYMVAHQAGTHAAAGAVLCAILAAGLTRLFVRRARFLPLLGAAALGVASHIWFDLFSGATIRLLWPLSSVPFDNLGMFAMADPWVAAACIVAAITIWWRQERSALTARVFLGVLLLFVAAKAWSRDEARSVAANAVPGAAEAILLPVWGSLSAWELYVHHEGAVKQWLIDRQNGLITQRMTVPEFGSPSETPLVMKTLDWDTVRNFRRTHAFAFARTSTASGVTTVRWSDLRYCHPAGEPAFGVAIACAVEAGGEIGGLHATPRLFVRVGSIVQRR